ncbi:MAG: trypsin-like peptidase domain-containing protein [Opitutales bacterium]|jgi:serine protease Do|nr:trypsin-like peptidase domain-containing protein [Opitutales bacterium]MDB2499361.1 trypsin-like peptidase domain-containing protein [bacterium]MDG2169925.1 trypsin-like peptidase domain-containing protein [Opitutales bacterium]
MIPKRIYYLPYILFVTLFFTACETTQSVSSSEESAEAGFKRLLEAVVRIDVREVTYRGGSKQNVSGVGSGVIISEEGHILTNAHVVSTFAEEIRITLSNLERVSAKLIGWDHWTDLALLKLDLDELEGRGLSFTIAEFGDSDEVYPGLTVFAVGTPNGLTRTVSRGIISNTNRFFEGADGVRGYETGYFNTWLQTDAAINPGNSGGPLVREDGKIIGINTRAYLGSNNLGFAVPGKTAQFVLSGLLESEEIVRSYSGITLGPMQDLENFYNLQANQGVLIESVDPGSPAANQGIQPGDILLSLDEDLVDGRFPEQLPPIQNTIANYSVGSDIVLDLNRQGQSITKTVTTEKLESRVGEEWAFDKWGLSIREVSRAYARENKLESDDGFLVLGSKTAFPAAKAGIRSGDIISKINRAPVGTMEELKQRHEEFTDDSEPLFVEVTRNYRTSLFILKP